ncbi:unnamed protein product, partial [Ectocarpus sp. 12 AP-2014]
LVTASFWRGVGRCGARCWAATCAVGAGGVLSRSGLPAQDVRYVCPEGVTWDRIYFCCCCCCCCCRTVRLRSGTRVGCTAASSLGAGGSTTAPLGGLLPRLFGSCSCRGRCC